MVRLYLAKIDFSLLLEQKKEKDCVEFQAKLTRIVVSNGIVRRFPAPGLSGNLDELDLTSGSQCDA